MRQQTKHMTKTYASIGRDGLTGYGPINFDSSIPGTLNKHPMELWDASRDQTMAYPDQCTCTTLPINAGPQQADERQSIYNSIKST